MGGKYTNEDISCVATVCDYFNPQDYVDCFYAVTVSFLIAHECLERSV